jgi:hypothetical protein
MIGHGPLFPNDSIKHNKKQILDRVGALRGQDAAARRLYSGTTKFALQTRRNLGSLALWQNC